MVANLRADNIDGYLGPDPFNQRAVFDGIGFIHLLTKELWDGHPCCAFTVSKEFATQNPNSYRRAAQVDHRGHRLRVQGRRTARRSPRQSRRQNYLNQPETVLEQILTGTYADGLGGVKKDPNRIDFDPFPWNQFAIWIMSQMKRWGQLKGDVDYAKVASDVYPRHRHGATMMKEMGLTPPDPSKKTIVVMGKPFDPIQARRIRQQLRHQAELMKPYQAPVARHSRRARSGNEDRATALLSDLSLFAGRPAVI